MSVLDGVAPFDGSVSALSRFTIVATAHSSPARGPRAGARSRRFPTLSALVDRAPMDGRVGPVRWRVDVFTMGYSRRMIVGTDPRRSLRAPPGSGAEYTFYRFHPSQPSPLTWDHSQVTSHACTRVPNIDESALSFAINCQMIDEPSVDHCTRHPVDFTNPFGLVGLRRH